MPNSDAIRSYRSKRSQYAAKACDECKRRKIKCDGQQPCARCFGQQFKCSYHQSTLDLPPEKRPKLDAQPKQAVRHSQDQPSSRISSTTLRNSTHSHSASDHLSLPLPSDAVEFCGPSSTEFTLNIATSNLHSNGPTLNVVGRTDLPRSSSTLFAQYGPFMKLLTLDPLWDFQRQEAIALVEDWCFGLGDVYPIIPRQKILDIVHRVFNALEPASEQGLNDQGGNVAEALFNHDANKLKIILAISLTKEAGGRNHRADRLFQSTSEAVEGLLWNPQGLHGVQLLYLTSMYHYHLNEEVRTGRTIAFAARLCLEMGLHRRNSIERYSQGHVSRTEALHAFWAVYMLERRLSLGQGIPFSIQDSVVDYSLQTLDRSSPLLDHLLVWTRLAGDIWYALNSYSAKSLASTLQDVTELDRKVLQWYATLPDEWKLSNCSIPPDKDDKTRYYQSVLFVRKSHLRCLIYRPIFQSPVYISERKQLFLAGIDVTKDTISTLVSLHESTALVRTHPLFFQQLLLTAFGNLLLAIVNARSTTWTGVRTEFDMVLALFKDLAANCSSLRRTWRRLQGLRDLPTRLLQPQRADPTYNGKATAGMSKDSDTNTNGMANLSYEDIFPQFPSLTREDGRRESQTASGDVESTTFEREPSPLPGHLDFDSFFEFPFLDLDSFESRAP